jgi:hydrogenase maturation protease
LREDDGVGLHVVSEVRRRLGRTRRLRTHPASLQPERVLSKIPPTDRILVIDAVQASLEPGAIVCAPLNETKYGFFATHNVPLRLLPGLSGRADVLVAGVQPGSAEVREGLTPAVKTSAEALADVIVKAVRETDG